VAALAVAAIPALMISGKLAHAANTAARCGSLRAASFAQTVSFTVSGSPADSQVLCLFVSAKLSHGLAKTERDYAD